MNESSHTTLIGMAKRDAHERSREHPLDARDTALARTALAFALTFEHGRILQDPTTYHWMLKHQVLTTAHGSRAMDALCDLERAATAAIGTELWCAIVLALSAVLVCAPTRQLRLASALLLLAMRLAWMAVHDGNSIQPSDSYVVWNLLLIASFDAPPSVATPALSVARFGTAFASGVAYLFAAVLKLISPSWRTGQVTGCTTRVRYLRYETSATHVAQASRLCSGLTLHVPAHSSTPSLRAGVRASLQWIHSAPALPATRHRCRRARALSSTHMERAGDRAAATTATLLWPPRQAPRPRPLRIDARGHAAAHRRTMDFPLPLLAPRCSQSRRQHCRPPPPPRATATPRRLAPPPRDHCLRGPRCRDLLELGLRSHVTVTLIVT